MTSSELSTLCGWDGGFEAVVLCVNRFDVPVSGSEDSVAVLVGRVSVFGVATWAMWAGSASVMAPIWEAVGLSAWAVSGALGDGLCGPALSLGCGVISERVGAALAGASLEPGGAEAVWGVSAVP
ncbi:MAG: hypothetical protein Rubg2KO_36820 [Rubricoccaceae bacterium]